MMTRPHTEDGEDDDEIMQDRIETVNELGISFARDNPNLGLEEVDERAPQRGKPRPGETFGDVWREGAMMPAGSPIDKRPTCGLPVNQKEVIETFKREASAIKPHESTVVGDPNK
jgi:hypothetical protein